VTASWLKIEYAKSLEQKGGKKNEEGGKEERKKKE